MAAITTRQTTSAVAGVTNNNNPLSNTQLDNNFINLNADKLEIGGTASAGTANGVLYLNGSKVTTTGSALVFDASKLGVGVSTPQYRLDVNNSGTGFQASFGSTFSTGSWSGIHFGYSETANQLYRKSAIVFERSDSSIGDARGKIHILNAEAGSGSATLSDARVTVLSNGNVGIGATSPGYKLEVNGSFAATTKSFVISHPTKPSKKLRYGSLEGPENGVYVRGKLVGNNRIELPEYWTKLVDPDSITVTLTPVGRHQDLYVEEVTDNAVVIKNGNLLLKEINCYYTVFAERIDVEKLQVECD